MRASHQLAPVTSQSKLSRSASGSAGVKRSPEPARIDVGPEIRQAQAICRAYSPLARPSTSRRSPSCTVSKSLSRSRPQSRSPRSGARTRSTMSFSDHPRSMKGDNYNRRPVCAWNQPPKICASRVPRTRPLAVPLLSHCPRPSLPMRLSRQRPWPPNQLASIRPSWMANPIGTR